MHTTLRKLNILDASNLLAREIIEVVMIESPESEYVQSIIKIIRKMTKSDDDIIDVVRFHQIMQAIQRESQTHLEVKCFHMIKEIVMSSSKHMLNEKIE